MSCCATLAQSLEIPLIAAVFSFFLFIVAVRTGFLCAPCISFGHAQVFRTVVLSEKNSVKEMKETKSSIRVSTRLFCVSIVNNGVVSSCGDFGRPVHKNLKRIKKKSKEWSQIHDLSYEDLFFLDPQY